ncbi:MAG: TonB-dependent receptor, partial [Bacteroidales bacterium]|nr:TonB-dependent receptor [Bacteroidales bacterium]
MKHRIISLLTIATIFAFSVPLHAQQEDTSSLGFHVTMEPIVISANHTPVSKRQAPSLVGVVDNNLMEATQSVCMGDALSFQCGVRVEDNCATCGFKQARINGLDGHYSQILIDSRPVLPSVAELFGLEQLPANMIERTEVMRGGGSALYGASAVGGTINIITRQPNSNSAYLSHSLMSIGGSGALDNTTSLGSSFVSKKDRTGATLFFQNRQRDGYNHYDDGYTTLPQLHMISAGTHAFFRTGEFSKLDVTYFLMDDSRRGGNKLNLPVEQANLAELNEHSMHNANVNYHWNSENNTWHADIFSSVAAMKRHSYAGGYLYDYAPDTNAYKYHTLTRDVAVNGGAMLRYYFQRLWFMPANLTFGTEYSGDYLRDTALSYALTTRQDVHIASVYVQNEWKNEQWDILLAARMDKHNLVSRPILSPRVALRYSPAKGLDLRAGYSEGFRAPQVFDQDLHVSMAGGERYTIVLAEGLKEERSHTANLSADYYATWNNIPMNFMIEGFYTALSGVFAQRELATLSPTGDQQMEKYNSSGARYFGVNLSWLAQYSSIFSSNIGITLQRSRYK